MKLNNLEKQRKEKGYTSQEKFADKIGIDRSTYNGYVNGNSIPSDILIKMSKLLNVSTDYILGLSDCRSVDNDYISKETGLSDDAINKLIEHKKNTRKRKQDDDVSKLTLSGINKLLEHSFGSSVLFWIGMYLDESEIKGYISKGKQIPFKELRKGKQIIHNDLYVYDESNKQLRIDYDIIRTAIFDKIRNSLFAVENE